MYKAIILSLIFSISGQCHLWATEVKRDSARLAFEKQIKDAHENMLKISKAHYNYGVYLDEMGKIEQSIYHLKIALQGAQSMGNDEMLANTANYLGSVYWIEGDCPNSTLYYEKALESALKGKNSNIVSIIKMNLSGNYSSAGNTEKAIEYALDALEIKEKDGIIDGICYDYVILGEIFQGIGNIEKWKYYVHKAYKLKDKESCAVMTDVVMIYNNLGRIAENQNQYDIALAYYDTIMQVSRPVNYHQGIGIALLNSALVKQMQGNCQIAYEMASQSEPHFGDVPYYKMAILNVKGELLQTMDRSLEALELAKINIQNENMSLYPALKQSCLNLLFKLNFELKNYQDAYNWNDSLRTYETRLREEENLKNIEELETKYQTEKKEQQIVLLSAENKIKNQRVYLFIALSLSLLLLLMVVAMLYYRNKKLHQQKHQALRQQLLRSQMNPHFLFNALGSIQNYMLNNDTRAAAGYLNNFASLTRAILEHSAVETVMLDEELKALHDYIKLEQMRLQNSFEYSIVLDDSVETEFINIPPMLIQPFVENAIKHGLKNREEKGQLTITIKEREDALEVSIKDNGSGFDPAMVKNNNHKSMAMEIFGQRISLLKKVHSKKASYNIQSSMDEGTKVVIDVPIID